jgi:hypothetical protein
MPFQRFDRNVEGTGQMPASNSSAGRTSSTVTRSFCIRETRSSRETGSSASRALK